MVDHKIDGVVSRICEECKKEIPKDELFIWMGNEKKMSYFHLKCLGVKS